MSRSSHVDGVELILRVAGVGSLQFVLDNANDKDGFNSSADVFFGFGCLFIALIPVVWFTKPPFTQLDRDAAH